MASGARAITARWLLCLVLLFCLISIGSAYAVKTIAVKPSGTPRAGEIVTLTTTIVFPGSPENAFDPGHALEFTTDLDLAVWTFEIPRDGISGPAIAAEGPTARLGGESLACGSGETLVCRVSVEGMAFSAVGDSEIVAIAIQETDADGLPVRGGSYGKAIGIDSSATLEALVREQRSALATLRLLMESKARDGVDIAAAEAKCRAAEEALAIAQAAPIGSTAAYAEFAKAQKYTAEVGPLLDLAVAAFGRGAAAATTAATTAPPMEQTTGTATDLSTSPTTTVSIAPAPEETIAGTPPVTTMEFPPAADATPVTVVQAATDTHGQPDTTAGDSRDALNRGGGLLDQIVGFFRALFGWDTPSS